MCAHARRSGTLTGARTRARRHTTTVSLRRRVALGRDERRGRWRRRRRAPSRRFEAGRQRSHRCVPLHSFQILISGSSGGGKVEFWQYVRRGIPRIPPRLARAGAVAHARLRRMRRARRRSPWGRSRTPR